MMMFRLLLVTVVSAQVKDPPKAAYHMNTPDLPLTTGRAEKGQGHVNYYIDVNGTLLDGSKMVVQLTTAQPKNGSRPQILEVKPFRRMCEHCDPCVCIGCGTLCDCQCNTKCNADCTGPTCSCFQTVGPLYPGRWYVTVDVDQPFTVEATVVGANRLQFQKKSFGMVASSDPYRTFFYSSEGMAWSNYYFIDADAHMSTSIEMTHVRNGLTPEHSGGSWLEIYMKSGSWPTTSEYDSMVTTKDQPNTQLLLADHNLLSERLFLLVLGRGTAWTEYSIKPVNSPNWFLIVGGTATVFITVSIFISCFNKRKQFNGDTNERRPLKASPAVQ